jgi:alkylation response protein AidB-like acyl-CoA dehydrogenase
MPDFSFTEEQELLRRTVREFCQKRLAPRGSEIDEKTLLEILAEDYRVNPGLFMTRADIKGRLASASDEQLNQVLTGGIAPKHGR